MFPLLPLNNELNTVKILQCLDLQELVGTIGLNKWSSQFVQSTPPLFAPHSIHLFIQEVTSTRAAMLSHVSNLVLECNDETRCHESKENRCTVQDALQKNLVNLMCFQHLKSFEFRSDSHPFNGQELQCLQAFASCLESLFQGLTSFHLDSYDDISSPFLCRLFVPLVAPHIQNLILSIYDDHTNEFEDWFLHSVAPQCIHLNRFELSPLEMPSSNAFLVGLIHAIPTLTSLDYEPEDVETSLQALSGTNRSNIRTIHHTSMSLNLAPLQGNGLNNLETLDFCGPHCNNAMFNVVSYLTALQSLPRLTTLSLSHPVPTGENCVQLGNSIISEWQAVLKCIRPFLQLRQLIVARIPADVLSVLCAIFPNLESIAIRFAPTVLNRLELAHWVFQAFPLLQTCQLCCESNLDWSTYRRIIVQ